VLLLALLLCFHLTAKSVLAVPGILDSASVLAFHGILSVGRILNVACIPVVVGVLPPMLLKSLLCWHPGWLAFASHFFN
jgi:hypothetical protein